MPSATEDARVFRLKAEYRRCGIYVLVGSVICLLLAMLLVSLPLQLPNRNADPREMAVVMMFFVAAATVLCLTLWNWRLRVDREGIARRRFWGWYLWPWEAFRSGAIRQGRSIGYYLWPEAAWTWRGLLLEMLDDGDCKEVDTLVKRIWVAPPEEELPEEVHFRVFRTKIRLLADGLDVQRGRTARQYKWKDIARVVIIRLEHDRRDFTRLIIELPEKAIELFVHQGNPNWHGAEAAVIARWFTVHAPADRVLNVALSGSPHSKAEADYRVNAIRQDSRKWRVAKRWIVAIAIVPFAVGIFEPRILVCGVMYGLLGYAYWSEYNKRDKRTGEEERELFAWLASHESQTDGDSNA